MNTFKPPQPLSLTGNVCENFRRFKQGFQIFMKAANLEKKDSSTKTAILLNVIGEEAVEVYNTFNLSEAEKSDFEKVFKAFEDYATPQKNVVVERYVFHSRFQSENEPFDSFITDLKKLVKSCEYGEQTESLIRDRIVLGIHSKSTQKKLLEMKDLSLEKAIAHCKTTELTKQQAEALQSPREQANVNYITKEKFFKKNQVSLKNSLANNEYLCKKCNKTHRKGECPAYGKKCQNCKKLNHFAAACRLQKVREVTDKRKEKTLAKCNEKEFVVDKLKLKSSKGNDKEWSKKIKVNNRNIVFKLDTGAQVNVMPQHIFETIHHTGPLHNTSVVLEAYGGSKIKTLGVTTLHCVIPEKQITQPIEFVIVEGNNRPLMGLPGCIKLQLVTQIDGVNTKNKTERDKFISKNKDIFEGVGKFTTKCEIEISEDALPIAKPPRRVPLAIKERLAVKLDKLEKEGIISKVENPKTWVSNLVIVEKPDGSLRLCLDPHELNKVIKRQYFLIPTFDDICSNLSNKSVYTVLDLKDGFYHMELDQKSSEMCTFSTPYGCYKFNRVPFGLSNAPELFQKLNEQNFGDIPGVSVYFDDLLIASEDTVTHEKVLKQVVERARDRNVKFNEAKLQYKVPQVKFLGHVFSKEGVQLDQDRIKALMALEIPKNKKELQRILGMVNYVRKFIPNMATLTQNMRELLKKSTEWTWLQAHTDELEKLKKIISSQPVLGTFDPKKNLKIQCDSSQNGLGCCLMCNEQPIAYASRSLTDTERGYAQIEKELLSIVFAVSKFHYYIYGRKVEVETDHKPLVTILKKEIAKVLSPRLQRMKIKLVKYNLDIKYLPGKFMHVADLLSRSFIKDKVDDDPELLEVIHSLSKNAQMSEEKKKLFREKTKTDAELSQLIEFCKKGWPQDKRLVPSNVKFYYKMKEEISTEDGLVFLNAKIIVPLELRHQMMELLHESHLGMDKTKARARQVLYWPGINRDIEKKIQQCSICARFQRSNQKEPILQHELPSLPFQKIAADIAEYGGHSYLIVACYYSKWLEIVKLNRKTADGVILKLKSIFATHGIPQQFVADNMPFGSFTFSKFAKEWGFEIITSSPHYPKSNGFAEKMVGIAKSILKKSKGQEFLIPLLEYRTTPISGLDASPSEILMSRILRTKLPVTAKVLAPKLQHFMKQKLTRKREKQAVYYNRHSRELRDFRPKEPVLVQRGNQRVWEPAEVVEQHRSPRSYMIETKDGAIIRRNRFHLKKREMS